MVVVVAAVAVAVFFCGTRKREREREREGRTGEIKAVHEGKRTIWRRGSGDGAVMAGWA